MNKGFGAVQILLTIKSTKNIASKKIILIVK